MTKQIDWNSTYQKNSPKLLGICRRYVKDIKTAEDILQEAFIVAIQKQELYSGIGSLEGWLKRIVINMSLNYLKIEQRNKYLTKEITDIEDMEEHFEGSHSSKSNIYAVDFTKEELLDIIDALPYHHKTVFNLYVIDRFSHVKIGQLLNISVGTSKSHLYRARMKIQAFLFEKAKEKEVDKSKKIIISLLLLLGFENKIIADTFKSKLSNLEILPTRIANDFDDYLYQFPTEEVSSNLFLNVFRYKWFLGMTSAGLILAFFNSSSTYNLLPVSYMKNQSKEELTVKTDSIAALHNSCITENSSKTIEDSSEAVLKSIGQKTTSLLKIQSKSPKQIVESEVDSTNDMINNVPQKVIIKKQVIKKDTVYVFK